MENELVKENERLKLALIGNRRHQDEPPSQQSDASGHE